MSSKPWSHRLPLWGRYATTCVSAVLCSLIVTFIHRCGAIDNIPYGFVVAMILLLLSAWCSRARSGWWGLFIHATVFSAFAWILALGFIGSAILVPVGFTIPVPWCVHYAGYLWLYGILIAHAILLCMPQRWFVVYSVKQVKNLQ